MTNYEVRLWYHDRLTAIRLQDSEFERQGLPVEERARWAHAARQAARSEARSLMHPDDAALLEARDLNKYGHPDGPAFDELVAQHLKLGLSHEEAWRRVLESSTRSDQGTDARLGIIPP